MNRRAVFVLALALSAGAQPALADCAPLRPQQQPADGAAAELKRTANAFKNRLLLKASPYSAAEIENDLRALAPGMDADGFRALLQAACEAVAAADLPVVRKVEVTEGLLAIGATP
jgi:hypothetical protein